MQLLEWLSQTAAVAKRIPPLGGVGLASPLLGALFSHEVRLLEQLFGRQKENLNSDTE